MNWYDLYRKNFSIPSNATSDFWGNPLGDNPRIGKTVLKDGQETTFKRGFTFNEYIGAWNKHHPAVWAYENGLSEDNLRLGDALSDYFNNQTVKDILNINDTMYPNNNSRWQACNGEMNELWHRQNEGSLWIYRVMYHQEDIKMLFFSGDTDGAVPALGTRKWIDKLNWEIKRPWRAWVHEGQVQGFIEHRRGHFDFATVRGVGHMAPQWKRAPMQYLITQWIHGKNITTLDPYEANPDLIEW